MRDDTRPLEATVTPHEPGSRHLGSRHGDWRSRVGSAKVPARITGVFWAVKLLSTAMGEATSDSLVHGINEYLAVVLGFVAFVVAMAIQLAARTYSPWRYWLAVTMVAVFGTMAADVLHIALHVPYAASSALYLVVLVAVLAYWKQSQGTIAIHSVTTPDRELCYWATVLATFALGTAVGDLTATTLSLGYLRSGVLFTLAFCVPGVAYALLRRHEVLAFWVAYILTRPLGASFADYLGFGHRAGGLGLGHPVTAAIFLVPIVVLVAYVAASRLDAGEAGAGEVGAGEVGAGEVGAVGAGVGGAGVGGLRRGRVTDLGSGPELVD